MDATAKKDFTSENTFIYGHYTAQNIMFGEVGNYLKQSFYENHNEIYLYTPTKNYIVKIFSAYMDEAISESYQMNFSNKAAYKRYVKLIKHKSVIHSDIEPNIDRIITLYTCTKWTSKEKQSRYFIHGIIREI